MVPQYIHLPLKDAALDLVFNLEHQHSEGIGTFKWSVLVLAYQLITLLNVEI